jgi:hypothetical protein
MSTATYALAPGPQQALVHWRAFVSSHSVDVLRPLLAEHVVFHSPFVRSPIPGRTATLLVLTTVAEIFEGFKYHRTFIGGTHDVALEFSASIGKWELKGLDLIKFDDAGQVVEFEVMVRPAKALQALGEAMGAQIGPQLLAMKAAAGGL